MAHRTSPILGLVVGPGAEASLHQAAVAGLLATTAMVPLAHGLLEHRVEDALHDNPMLQRAPGQPCITCGTWCSGLRCADCYLTSAGVSGEPAVDPFVGLDVLVGCEVSQACRHVVPLVLGDLDERGLLPGGAAGVAARHGIPRWMADDVIYAVRQTGPAGIAEPTMIDSLAVQARALGVEGKAPAWAESVVRHHLEEFARRDAAAVADALGVSVRQVREVFERLRTQLRPSVLPEFQEPRSLVPVDVVVTRRGSDLQVAVPDSRWFGLRITRVPVHLRVDIEASSWLRGFEQEAVQLVRQIDARAAVLTRVAGHAVAHQTAFLTTGPTDHRPLTRVQVARELGLHPSTVSRAVSGKTLRGPDGVVMALARLFGGNIAVKEELRLLLGEGSHTDEELRRELECRGFEVARRTVAKYRREIGVGPVSE